MPSSIPIDCWRKDDERAISTHRYSVCTHWRRMIEEARTGDVDPRVTNEKGVENMLLSVKGVFDGKQVKLLEQVSLPEGIQVIITFLADEDLAEFHRISGSGKEMSSLSEAKDTLRESRLFHQRVKASILKTHPELQRLEGKALRRDFDRLSGKIAQNMPFSDWKAAERFMRGEDRLDFDRHQYLSD